MTSYEQAVGFWSYTHRDNELNGGRITELARRIANDYEVLTAERIRIFIDKDDLEWGAEWESRIEAQLAGTTFFIPVVTPAFFKSEACRSEVLRFSGHATSLNLGELLLPILYAKVSDLHEGSADEVKAIIAKRQYVDCTKLRTEDEESPVYRKIVADLAERLIDILERAIPQASENEREIEAKGEKGEAEEEDEAVLEIMATMEEALPRLGSVTLDFANVMAEIGAEVEKSVTQIDQSDARGGGFAGRLRVSHQLAEKIADPVNRFYNLGVEYAAELVKVDPGILSLIREASTQDSSLEDHAELQELFSSVKEAVAASRANVPILESFSESVKSIRGVSKAMRPHAQKMESAVRHVTDGQAILDEWERLIDEVEESV